MPTKQQLEDELAKAYALLGYRSCIKCGTWNKGVRPQRIGDTPEFSALIFYDVEGVLFCEPCADDDVLPEHRRKELER